jgi:putative membrane protein insertion efficiency factor
MSAAAVLSAPFVLLVRGYQRLISPLLPSRCRYYPTCSAYAVTALTRFGPLRGGYLALHRIGRCHPWSAGGIDFVPDSWAERGSPALREPRLGDDTPALTEADLEDLRRRTGAPRERRTTSS